MPRLLTIETHPGQAVTNAGWKITPFAQGWRLQLPSSRSKFRNGLIWLRPVSVLVTHPDGQERILPVPDPTRRIVWSLAGIGLAALLATVWMNLISEREV